MLALGKILEPLRAIKEKREGLVVDYRPLRKNSRNCHMYDADVGWKYLSLSLGFSCGWLLRFKGLVHYLQVTTIVSKRGCRDLSHIMCLRDRESMFQNSIMHAIWINHGYDDWERKHITRELRTGANSILKDCVTKAVTSWSSPCGTLGLEPRCRHLRFRADTVQHDYKRHGTARLSKQAKEWSSKY